MNETYRNLWIKQTTLIQLSMLFVSWENGSIRKDKPDGNRLDNIVVLSLLLKH